MSFDLTRFSRISATGNDRAPILYSYVSTTDTVATILGSGYFNGLIQDLTNGVGVIKVNDLVVVQGSTAGDDGLIKVTAVTTAVTTARYTLDAIVPANITLTAGSMIVGVAGVGAEIDVSTNTAVMIGNGTTGVMKVLSGDVTMTNAGVVTIATGSVEAEMLAVPKMRTPVRHTWAGGVATTDTVTLTGVAATDIIHVTVNANSGVGAVVSAERSGVDSILVTMSANMANGDILSVTAIQVV